MVEIFCTMVGGTGNTFVVEVDETARVRDLQRAIEATMPVMIRCNADELQLFLAKRKGLEGEEQKSSDEAKWLTQREVRERGVSDTSGFDRLRYPDVPLQDAGLGSVDLGEVSQADIMVGLGHVHVLVVAPGSVPSLSVPSSLELEVPAKLDRLGVPFTTRDLNFLLIHDTAKYNFLRSAALTRHEALVILAFARSAIKSATRDAIAMHQGFTLDGPLKLRQAQAKAALYYAYSRCGGVLAAKVYTAMHRPTFQREVDANRALGAHANIVQFVKSFSEANTEGEQRHVIVMPFFARSAADLLECSPVELRALAVIARDCVSALSHIHSKKYCFADLKPANIMLYCGEQGGAALVDFSGTVRLGEHLVEITDQFCLDVGTSQGSELLDWTCLGTTLAQLAGIDITQFFSRQELVTFLNGGRHSVNECVGELITSCLVEPRRSRIDAAVALLLNSLVPTINQHPDVPVHSQGCLASGRS